MPLRPSWNEEFAARLTIGHQNLFGYRSGTTMVKEHLCWERNLRSGPMSTNGGKT